MFPLRPTPKVTADGSHRSVPPEATLARVAPLMPHIGVTRVADLTGLDHLGVPVYAAIRPGDTGYNIYVHNGKGATKLQAKIGAMMEALEIFCSEQLVGESHIAPYAAFSQEARVLSPKSLVLPLRDEVPPLTDIEALPIEWIRGTDLFSGEPTWVPADAVLARQRPPGVLPLFFGSTNGLASGNTHEEAICHALAELIERDAFSLTEIRIQLRARLAALLHQLFPDAPPARREQVPDLDLASVQDEAIVALVERFRRAQLPLAVKVITSDLGVPTFLAVTTRDYGDHLALHTGQGCHPNAHVALTRALTEAAQSRAAHIQGSREDYVQQRHATVSAWLLEPAPDSVPFDSLPSWNYTDVLDDLTFMLERLRQAGIGQAVAVDLTLPTLNVPVVRVVVPSLETLAISEHLGFPAVVGPRGRALAGAGLGGGS